VFEVKNPTCESLKTRVNVTLPIPRRGATFTKFVDPAAGVAVPVPVPVVGGTGIVHGEDPDEDTTVPNPARKLFVGAVSTFTLSLRYR
jgi:hypothetical protein